MYGHDSEPSIVYSYGCKPPLTERKRCEDQMRASHRYRNTLVEIERARRETAAAAVRQHSPDLAAAQDRLAEADGRVAELAAAMRAAKQAPHRHHMTEARLAEIVRAAEQAKGRIAEARKEKREAARRERALRRAAYGDPALKDRLAAIDGHARMLSKDARAQSGLYWGTYLAVEQGLARMRSGPPPRFARWTGDGKLAVQIQHGISVEDAFGGRDNRLRLRPLPERLAHPQMTRERLLVEMRVGSDGREPIFAELAMRLHRPLPADARIKWVYLVRRRHGGDESWSLQFVLARAAGWSKTDVASTGRVGIDVGWRLLHDRLRVAYWVDDAGREGELSIPLRDVARWRKAEDLQSIRAQHFDAARDRLARWLAGEPVISAMLPGRPRLIEAGAPIDWLVERASTIRQWRSAGRLAGLVIHWRANRFAGDAVIFDELEAWRRKDKHLWNWGANQRRKAIAWREDLYRRFSAEMRRRYRTVVVEDADWRNLARRPMPEDEPDHAARLYRRVAAPGRLREILAQSAAETIRAATKHTTQRCSGCGGLMGADAAARLRIRCGQCGLEIDQDRNAALNLLRASGPVAAETP